MPTAAQEFVPIKEIRDGVVVLKDGSLRAVLMTSSINFALKSADEQQSVLYQFQNFLNSLDFPIQVSIQSRELDIRPYLNLLQEQADEQVNDLLKIQTEEYIEFIKEFTAETNIMAKHFYVVVPYTPAYLGSSGGALEKLKGLLGLSSNEDENDDEQTFREHVSQLEERLSVVEQGLLRSGVRTARLGTDEATELYYQTLNPGETDIPLT